MKRSRYIAAPLAAFLITFYVFALVGGSAVSHAPKAKAGQLGIEDEMTDEQERLLSGFAAYELSGNAGNDSNSSNLNAPTTYFSSGSGDCPNNQSSNIKVNQNCLNLSDPDLQGRAQAQNEESITVDPNNSNHVVASYNDYRRGDGTCGTSWSADGGRTWNDSTTPNGFTRGTTRPRQYWQAGGDTSVAFDSKGNAYLSCQVFDRGPGVSTNPDQSSGFFIFRSTGNGGASWNFPGRSVFQTTQNSFLPLED